VLRTLTGMMFSVVSIFLILLQQTRRDAMVCLTCFARGAAKAVEK